MTEAQLLEAFQTTMDAQITLLSQIVALHLAMIVGIYYFLGRAGIGLKLFAFFVYTVSYGTFLSLSLLASVIAYWIDAAADRRLAAGAESGVLSLISALNSSWLAYGGAIFANVMLIGLWFGTGYFLFFYKSRAPGAPVMAKGADTSAAA